MIITLPQVFTFFLIFSRLVGMMITAPVFSRKELFFVAKVGIVLWISSLLIFVVPLPANPPTTFLPFVLAAISELFIGGIIGFIADLLVTGVEFAGGIMDTQAGLSVASLLDPSSGRNLSLIALLLKWTAVIMFLVIDGHHLVLSAIVQSFQILPIGEPINIAEGAKYTASLGAYIFYLAVQLSAPIILVIFMVDFGFGMLNKVAEQINVFQLGFQLKPSVALFVFLAMAPTLVAAVYGVLEETTEHMLKLFYYLQT